jgi:uncharacterized phage infection (PIP) family protein YhgE
VAPIVIGAVLIGLMTVLYLGSAVDPVDHMDGLPVSLVQRDAGGDSIGGIEVNLGDQLERALLDAPEVAHNSTSTSSRWRRRKTGWTAAPPTRPSSSRPTSPTRR